MAATMKSVEKDIKDAIYNFIFSVRKKKAYFFIYLSRQFLKNEGGWDLYLLDRLKYRRIRKAASNEARIGRNNDKSRAVVSFLHENKYAPVELAIPPEKLDAIRNKIDKLINDDEHSYPRGKFAEHDGKKVHYSRALKALIENIPEVKELLNEELQDIISEYYGSNFGVTSILCWRNYHVPETESRKALYSNDWHNDYIAPSELKLFINITDVTDNDGPLHVISAPNTKKLIKNKAFAGRFGTNDLSQIESKEHVVKHTGPAGSAVFCHASDCLHRADIPAEGHYRDMLEFQFHPSVEPLDKNWELSALKYK